MKRISILILVLLTISGCSGTRPPLVPINQTIIISGHIYDDSTKNPIPLVTILMESEGLPLTSIQTDNTGYFTVTLKKTQSLVSLTLHHIDYWSKAEQLDPKLITENLAYSLQKIAEQRYDYNGRIDFALPQLLNSLAESASPRATMDDTASAQRYEMDQRATEIIVYTDSPTLDQAKRIQADIGAASFRLRPRIGAIIFATEDEQVELLLAKAVAHHLVNRADINYITYALSASYPNDPRFPEQWSLPAIYLPAAWQVTTGDRNIRVAVLDTGIDTNHLDLSVNTRLDLAYNAINDNTNVHDAGSTSGTPRSHGTHVAGIIAATTNNTIGIAGVVANVTLVPIKVMASTNSGSAGTLADLMSGLQHAIDLGVDIINLSLGYSGYNEDIHQLLQKAADLGIVVVAAAGNTGTLLYPAKHEEVIAVGATSHHQNITDYSAVDGVSLFAPGGSKLGGGILSTDLSTVLGGYTQASGTSMAAPHVAGIIALMMSTGKAPRTVEETASLLWQTGIELDFNKPGTRLVNAYAAVTQAQIDNTRLTFTRTDNPEQTLTAFVTISERHFQLRLPAGEYRVTAHLDINSNQIRDQGDWYWQDTVEICLESPTEPLAIRLELEGK